MLAKFYSFRFVTLLVVTILQPYISAAQLGFGFQLSNSNTMNAPSENFREFIGFEFIADGRFEYNPLVFSVQVSIMNSFPREKFSRTINDSQNSIVPFYNSSEYSSFMIGLSYYPVQKRAVINPFVRCLVGIGVSSHEVFYGDRPSRKLVLGYTDHVPTIMTSFSGRVGVGLDFSITNLSKKEKEFDFAIKLSSSFNYLSRVYYIDPNVLDGDNLVIGNLYNSQEQVTYAVDIGNLYRFSPRFLTFEIGFVWRLMSFDDQDKEPGFMKY